MTEDVPATPEHLRAYDAVFFYILQGSMIVEIGFVPRDILHEVFANHQQCTRKVFITELSHALH